VNAEGAAKAAKAPKIRAKEEIWGATSNPKIFLGA
jgi:hypothetical protein